MMTLHGIKRFSLIRGLTARHSADHKVMPLAYTNGERLVGQQNNYFTTIITSKKSEMSNDNDEIESASNVLLEIILLALDSSFI